jgi:cytochrome c peroxidase
MKMKFSLLLLVFSLLWFGCGKDNPVSGCDNCEDNDLIEAAYDPKPYELDIPDWLPRPALPEDNPLTEAGVKLGRQLFYDPILSSDGTMSCATCHRQELAFTDGRAVSTGVLGLEGRRSSMSLVNMVFRTNGFFWDGRSKTLEEQALVPVEDHLEMNENWGAVVAKLQAHGEYPELFREAFGIDRKKEITKELTVKAIAQFERTLISGYSRFDRVVWMNEGWFTDSEQRGKQLFFFEPVTDHPGCSHCHFDPLFTDNSFKNNGLDSVANLTDFADLGLGGVNNNLYDNGKFKVPTLRNIALTAPYMHDGRFATLEEVLDHYSAGGHGLVNEDTNILPFPLTEQQKQDLIAFLKTLTDESFLTNPAFSNPFE